MSKRFTNVSSRVDIKPGDNAMIGGFYIKGSAPKKLLLRALGSSLVASGVPTAMVNPKLDLYSSSGQLIVSNDDWASQAELVGATGLAPAHPQDSAMIVTLPIGGYTAVVQGSAAASGIALLEVYDLETQNSQLANFSSRGYVGGGNSVLIGGLSIAGQDSTKVMIRALGPSLASAGIAGVLLDPVVQLRDQNGSLIFENDNWRKAQKNQIVRSGLAPSNTREAAIIATLRPGSYTARVYGRNGATGVALLEFYNLEP